MIVSNHYSTLKGRLLTCYSPVRHWSEPKFFTVRLACVKRAASVRPEPGSNSQVKPFVPKRPPASYLSDASQIYMRLSFLRRLYILSFLFFTSFNDRVSIYILSPYPRQPIICFFLTFFYRTTPSLSRNPFSLRFRRPSFHPSLQSN